MSARTQRLFCAWCLRDKPSFEYMMYANGSRIMCDRCWVIFRCGTWCGRWLARLSWGRAA